MTNLHFWTRALGGIVLLEQHEGTATLVYALDVRGAEAFSENVFGTPERPVHVAKAPLIVLAGETPSAALARTREVSCNPVAFKLEHALEFARTFLGWNDEIVELGGNVVHAQVPTVLPRREDILRPQAPAQRPAHIPEWMDIPPGSDIAPPGPSSLSARPDWLADPTGGAAGAAHSRPDPLAAQPAAGLQGGTLQPSPYPVIPADGLAPEVREAIERMNATVLAQSSGDVSTPTVPGTLQTHLVPPGFEDASQPEPETQKAGA